MEMVAWRYQWESVRECLLVKERKQMRGKGWLAKGSRDICEMSDGG